MADQVKQQIESQKKYNEATRWKCRLFSIASIVLAIILAIQLVNTDKEVAKVVNQKNITDLTNDVINKVSTKTTDTVNELIEQGSDKIN